MHQALRAALGNAPRDHATRQRLFDEIDSEALGTVDFEALHLWLEARGMRAADKQVHGLSSLLHTWTHAPSAPRLTTSTQVDDTCAG